MFSRHLLSVFTYNYVSLLIFFVRLFCTDKFSRLNSITMILRISIFFKTRSRVIRNGCRATAAIALNHLKRQLLFASFGHSFSLHNVSVICTSRRRKANSRAHTRALYGCTQPPPPPPNPSVVRVRIYRGLFWWVSLIFHFLVTPSHAFK